MISCRIEQISKITFCILYYSLFINYCQSDIGRSLSETLSLLSQQTSVVQFPLKETRDFWFPGVSQLLMWYQYLYPGITWNNNICVHFFLAVLFSMSGDGRLWGQTWATSNMPNLLGSAPKSKVITSGGRLILNLQTLIVSRILPCLHSFCSTCLSDLLPQPR